MPSPAPKRGTARPSRHTVGHARPSSESDRLWQRYQELFPRYFWSDETRLASIIVARARGATVTDVDGREYIDLTSQWATNNLGNVPPEVLRAAVEALERYGFLIYFIHPHLPMIELAEKLIEVRPSANLTRVFLELSGTGAAEGAVKYAVEARQRPLVLGFMGQYHGLSIGTNIIGSLSSRERRYWEAFQGGALHAPYPEPYHRPRGMSEEEYGGWVLDHIRDGILKYVADPSRIAAAILEPIACEAGIWIPPASFVRGLAKMCREYGWCFINDEVETGLGRTGRMWAVEHYGVSPDLMPIGKALSGGLMPIAAVLGTEETMGSGEIAAGTTFGGHPAACAAAAATLEIMRRDRIPERSARLGAAALKRMREWTRFDHVGDVRGLGLALAVELTEDKDARTPAPDRARRVFFDCVDRGIIPLWNYGDSFFRIQPSLTIPEPQLEQALDTIEAVLERNARR